METGTDIVVHNDDAEQEKAAIMGMFNEQAPSVTTNSKGIAIATRVEQSAHAVVTDRWSIRKSDEFMDEMGIQSDRGHDGEDLVDTHVMLADGLSICFEPSPEIINKDLCSDKLKSRWFHDLLDSAEFLALRVSTELDETLSLIASKKLFERYCEYKQKLTDDQKEQAEGDPQDEDIHGMLERIRSVANAADEAVVDIKDAKGASEVMGFGLEKGSGGDVAGVVRMFEAIRNNPTLRQISNHAGRFRKLALSLQRQTYTHGVDDMVGVCLSDEIGKLVPSELMLLCDEDLEIDLYRKLAEQQASCRDYRGIVGTGKGPIMVLVDESGSMSGNPIETAKGFALSLAWLAKQQNRWCCLVGWSSQWDVRRIVLDPNSLNNGQELMDWCLSFFSGGTQPPIAQVQEIFQETGAPLDDTDIIWITDGQCSPCEQEVALHNKWRAKARVRSWTVGIGSNPESFHSFSDVITEVTGLGTDTPVVKELLSL